MKTNKEEQKIINRGYYAIIPSNVRYDKSLPANAKLLYGEITALCNEKGYCWATNNYFAELYGVSKETISRWISKLIEHNYIFSEIKYKDDTKEIESRYLKLANTPIDEKINTPVDKKINTPVDEKIKENNTDINNTFINKKEKYKKEKKFFKKPTVEEVQEYCLEANINIDAERFIDFYESKGWKVGSAPMKDWKAATRNWSRRVNNTPALSSPSANKAITPGSFSSFTLEDLESKVNRRYESKAQEMMDQYERDLGIKT